jgi:hypothetical protein
MDRRLRVFRVRCVTNLGGELAKERRQGVGSALYLIRARPDA